MMLNVACSDDGIDRDDELGVGVRTPAEGYQLIVVGEGAGESGSSGAEIVAVDSAGTLIASPPPGEGPAEAAPSVEYDPEGAFTVQVGVYTDALRAAEKVRELDHLGYPAYAIARSGGDGVRVRIGYFRTRGDALRFGKMYSEDTGSEFWVDRRANEMY